MGTYWFSHWTSPRFTPFSMRGMVDGIREQSPKNTVGSTHILAVFHEGHQPCSTSKCTKKLPLIWRFRFRTAGEEDDPSHPFFGLIIHANIHMYIYIYAYKYYPEWRGPCFLPPFIRMLPQARCTTRCMSAFILCSTSEDGLPEGLQLTTQTCAHVNTYEDTPVRDVWINA